MTSGHKIFNELLYADLRLDEAYVRLKKCLHLHSIMTQKYGVYATKCDGKT